MTELKPISVQLYSLREEAKVDPLAVLTRLAAIGYKGVEPAGFYKWTPKEMKKIVEDLGMKIYSSHGPWAKPENLSEVIDTAGALGLDLASSGFGTEQFATLDAIRKTADMVNGMVEHLKRHSVKLFLHNHYWEFAPVGGRLAYDHFSQLCPGVFFEVDTYWAANFGANDPAREVAKLAKRALLLHIKDGPLVKDKAMLAVGKGKMDFKPVIAAADPAVVRALIVELDRCDTDMFTAIEESYRFLTEQGLAAGNK